MGIDYDLIRGLCDSTYSSLIKTIQLLVQEMNDEEFEKIPRIQFDITVYKILERYCTVIGFMRNDKIINLWMFGGAPFIAIYKFDSSENKNASQSGEMC
jgi:hypothetical protein